MKINSTKLFADKVLIGATTECWVWIGSTDSGYGQLQRKGKRLQAHRFAYELLVGPIPEGLTLDHLCRTRNCVNPIHVEPLSRGDNTRRAAPYRVANKIMCKFGHPLSGENLKIEVHNGQSRRRCLSCAREASARWRRAHPLERKESLIRYNLKKLVSL